MMNEELKFHHLKTLILDGEEPALERHDLPAFLAYLTRYSFLTPVGECRTKLNGKRFRVRNGTHDHTYEFVEGAMWPVFIQMRSTDLVIDDSELDGVKLKPNKTPLAEYDTTVLEKELHKRYAHAILEGLADADDRTVLDTIETIPDDRLVPLIRYAVSLLP